MGGEDEPAHGGHPPQARPRRGGRRQGGRQAQVRPRRRPLSKLAGSAGDGIWRGGNPRGRGVGRGQHWNTGMPRARYVRVDSATKYYVSDEPPATLRNISTNMERSPPEDREVC